MRIVIFFIKLLAIILLPGIFILGACLTTNEGLQALFAFASIITGALAIVPIIDIVDEF